MFGADRVDGFLARIEELEDRSRALEEQIRGLEHDRSSAHQADDQVHVSRRHVLGGAGAVAMAGVGGALLAALPAGAVDPNDVVLGATGQDAGTNSTAITSSNDSESFRADNTGSGKGVVGVSVSNMGVHGTSTSNIGVQGTSTSSFGVVGNSTSGTAVFGGSSSATGVSASSTTGSGMNTQSISGNSIRVVAPTANTAGAHLLLQPGSILGPPTGGAHTLGQLWMDSAGVLFQCVVAGTPGTWVRQAPLVPLAAPVRVYDSRAGQPNQAPNVQGSLTFTSAPPSAANRVIRCNKDASTGSTVVPANARSLLLNLAVVTLSGVGTLAVYADGAVQPAAASINWFAGGQVLSNAVTTACDADQDVRVAIVSGAGASTNFILDVVGYYL